MMGDIYIAAHLRRCLRHSVIGHVLQHTPSTSVLDALHLHHAVKSPPLRHSSPSHRTFIEAKNEHVKTKHVFQMKENTYTTTHQKKKTDIDTHTIMYQAKFAGRHIETIMYPANFAGGRIETIMYPANFPAIDIETIMYQAKFAGGRSRLDLLLPSFLPSREEKKKQERRNQSIDSGAEWHTPHMNHVRIETKKQERVFCPLRGYSVGRMQYAPTTCRQETLFPINSREERIETKIQEQKNRPLGSRGVLHTPDMDRVRTETKMQERIKQSIDSVAEWHNPHTDLVRIETKMQERIFCPLRGHAVGRMQYAPTSYRQETLFPINSREERIETKIQEQKNRPLGSRAQKHTPHTDRVRTETKMQERRKQSIDSGVEWHTPFMRHGERDVVWREAFLKQRVRVAVWRDRRLKEKYSHVRLQLKTSGENSKPYKFSLVALSEQLRDIFAA